MTPTLRSDVFAVAIEGDLALLDLSRDRYLCMARCLPNAAVFDPDDPETWSPDLARQLADAEVLGPPAERSDRCTPSLPTRSLAHAGPPQPPTALDCLQGLRAVRAVRRALRQPGLLPLLAAAAPEPARRAAGPEAREVAGRLSRLLPWLPIEGHCLVRSALLVHVLNARGLAADWVFGVRLWPFSAHCWVQAGDVCLNDDAERLIGFTPIYRR